MVIAVQSGLPHLREYLRQQGYDVITLGEHSCEAIWCFMKLLPLFLLFQPIITAYIPMCPFSMYRDAPFRKF